LALLQPVSYAEPVLAASADERAIRALVETWTSAAKAGDLATVLSLMTDDVVFMVPGRAPFGKSEFAKSSQECKHFRFESRCEIQEIQVMGRWAFLRNRLEVTVTPAKGEDTIRCSGHTLAILRKGMDGRWRLARDANLTA
jgi:uncharacterized protein (TIGR02246 family)